MHLEKQTWASCKTQWEARFYDGKKAGAHDVTVTFKTFGLVVKLPEMPCGIIWKFEDIKILAKPEYNRPLILSRTDTPDARLVFADNALYNCIIAQIPKQHKPCLSISTSAKSLIMWFVLAIAVIGLLFWSMPRISQSIAKNLPKNWEENLGEYAINMLVSDTPTCQSAEGQAALEKIVARLTATPTSSLEPINVRVVEEELPNAFAVPGNKIVIFSGLIDKAEDEMEVAGVIAHELGHVVQKHASENLINAIGLKLAITLMFGNNSHTTSGASILGDIYQLNNSREFEQDADAFATNVLYEAKIDNQGFARFFKKLEKNKGLEVFSYVSTHPATSDRINSIKSSKNTLQPTQILSEKEWTALKAICEETSTPEVE